MKALLGWAPNASGNRQLLTGRLFGDPHVHKDGDQFVNDHRLKSRIRIGMFTAILEGTMNRLLVTLLTGFNAIYAILIVAGFTLAAAGYAPGMQGSSFIGLFFGIIIATFTCGIIAVVLVINRNLEKIEKHMSFLVKSAAYQNDLAKMSLERQINTPASVTPSPAQPSQT